MSQIVPIRTQVFLEYSTDAVKQAEMNPSE